MDVGGWGVGGGGWGVGGGGMYLVSSTTFTSAGAVIGVFEWPGGRGWMLGGGGWGVGGGGWGDGVRSWSR